MAANYRNKRQDVGGGGRLASQSQLTGGSQPNLAGQPGTLNRTQVERRPAQFISASRSRLDSDSVIDERTSPNSAAAALKRTAKSQDRLNSTSSSTGYSSGRGTSSNSSTIGTAAYSRPTNTSSSNIGSGTSGRGNLAQPPSQAGSKSQAYVEPAGSGRASGPHQVPSPSYSNISNYSTINNEFADKEKTTNRTSREIVTSPSNYQNQLNVTSITKTRSPAPTTDNSFYEFEKVRLDYLRRGKLYEDTVFLPTDASIYFSRNPPFRIDWMRAKVSQCCLHYPLCIGLKGYLHVHILL